MTINLRNEYFRWLCDFVYTISDYKQAKYTKLFRKMFERDFVWSIPMDKNRALDGLSLRNRFLSEHDYTNPDIYVNSGQCSILEMMVALALRCEESLMTNADEGDRTGQWFWEMIANLGLGKMSDENYSEEYVNFILDRFISRSYEPNGEGGLFLVERLGIDMREIEIWYQLSWHLNDILGLNERRTYQ